MKPKVFWISLIVGLLTAHVGLHMVLLFAAVNDPSFAVEPDYERKAVEWDDIQRERERSQRFGWTVDLSTRPADTPGQVDVSLTLFDRFGKPVRDATAQVEAFHNARASNVVRQGLPHDADGVYAARLPLRRSGIWEFRLRVVRGDQVYVDTLRKSVLSVPRSRGATS